VVATPLFFEANGFERYKVSQNKFTCYNFVVVQCGRNCTFPSISVFFLHDRGWSSQMLFGLKSMCGEGKKAFLMIITEADWLVLY
jgi:hypothetical protein